MKRPANNVSLKNRLDHRNFNRICCEFHKQLDLPLAVCDRDGKEIRSLCEAAHLPELCRRIRQSKVGASRCRQHRQDSLAAAVQSRSPQISICHAGIVSACVPIMNGTSSLGGIFFGKCLVSRFNPKLEADVQDRLKGLRIYPHEILEGLSELPVVPPRNIQSSAIILQNLIHETMRSKQSSVSPQPLKAATKPVCQPGQSQRQPDVKKMARLKPAIDLIRYNYAEPLTLAVIAYAANMSVSRLAHLFAEQMGTTVIDYLNTIRIDHAKRLLKTTDTTCTRIAYTVGFNSPAYFARVFKKHTGQTPNEYRNKKK